MLTIHCASEWGLGDKFVVGYSGNLGRAHEFDTVLAAAERLRHAPRIVFLFIGGGQRMDDLARIVKARGLDATFRFVPYQDRTLLTHSLGVPDIHWISLKPAVEGMIVPSKFYGIAAAGRPIIAITARDGELARLVLEHECGLVVEPGQAEALADAITQSVDRSAIARRHGRSRPRHVECTLHAPAGARALVRPARSDRISRPQASVRRVDACVLCTPPVDDASNSISAKPSERELPQNRQFGAAELRLQYGIQILN